MMRKARIPDTMKVAVLNSYSGVDALSIEQRPIPTPGKNEVLVKVAFAPINPSDLATLVGYYGLKNPTPIVPGGEGSGEVVAAGPGVMAGYFLGKKVSCSGWGIGGGVWSEYVVKSVKGGVLSLNKSLSLEQGAMSLINPLTASAFIDISKKGGHKAILLTAAASSLGQMVNRLGRSEGIQIINVVRRDAQVDLLKAQGADIVLNSTEAGFDQQLHDACHQANSRIAFDAVAGQLTNQLLKAMPTDSKVIVFSALSRQAIQASPDLLIFENKKIDSFWLGPWISKQNIGKMMLLWKRAQKQIPNHLKSDIRKIYPLQDVKEAIRDYTSQMTGGKILLRM
ncbi:zinc-binding dehydrogenase [Aquimarina sp. MMG016]|uniref:alcohol dehydrogenase catalytic domain-containing protein n=1 Tax=Aquimarina sp. MMG016 TaxID=2822690 RepID=UPI001B39E90A|nr:zinc-binding dehydrogenase [Aquimarina sp. MMG016]MBQ4819166.1 zinc-binding dehydrogenase [Aquimarina sp. MMG016]